MTAHLITEKLIWTITSYQVRNWTKKMGGPFKSSYSQSLLIEYGTEHKQHDYIPIVAGGEGSITGFFER